MGEVVTIGLDIAKSVFQVHGVGADGEVLIRRRVTRGRMLPFFAKLPRCLIGIEACNNSHYWARELTALGHDVKLMPAQHVKPYVKRGKNDAADAEAISLRSCRGDQIFVGTHQPSMSDAACGAAKDRWISVTGFRRRNELQSAPKPYNPRYGRGHSRRES